MEILSRSSLVCIGPYKKNIIPARFFVIVELQVKNQVQRKCLSL